MPIFIGSGRARQARHYAIAMLLVVLWFLGCGPRSGNPRPLDRDLALRSLDVFLTVWRDGSGLESLKQQTPPIVSNDPDWGAGAKLVAFEVLPATEDDGSNLYVDVKMQLAEAERAQERKIRFVIGTAPVVSVFRDQ